MLIGQLLCFVAWVKLQRTALEELISFGEITSNKGPTGWLLYGSGSSTVSHSAARLKLGVRIRRSRCRNPRLVVGQINKLQGSSGQSFLSCRPPSFKRQEKRPEMAKACWPSSNSRSSGGSEIITRDLRYPHISIITSSTLTFLPPSTFPVFTDFTRYQ